MKKILTSERSLVIILTIFVVAVSLFQLFVYILKTPTGFVYPLVHNYVPDFYWYLSLMEQGREGHLLLTTRFTSESFPPQFVNTFFALLGMFAGLTKISLPVMYTLARIFFGTTLLLMSLRLLRELGMGKRERWIAFLFIIFGVPIGTSGLFWTGFDPLLRVTFLPHHLAANTLFIVTLIHCLIAIRKQSIKWGLLASLMIILAGWFNPAVFIVFYLTVGISFILSIKQLSRLVVLLPVILLPIIPIALLLKIQNSVFPWTAFRDWERFNQYPIDLVGLVGVLGVVGILAFIGLPKLLRSPKEERFGWNLIIGWFLAPFVGLLLVKFLPISNGRFLQSAPYIPAGILAAWTIGRLEDRKIGSIVVILIIIFSLPSFASSLQRQLKWVEENKTNPLIYVSKNTLVSLDWLNKNGKPEEVALAPAEISLLIPGFTNKRAVFGHPTFTLDSEKKLQMTEDQLLNTNHVDYLISNKDGKITISQIRK